MDENESLYGEQAGEVVEPQDGEAAAQAEGEKSPDTAEQGRQSHEDNRRYQAARRAGEQAGYERAQREYNERISRVGMRDPGTGEAIEDMDGLERYSKSVRAQRIAQKAKDEGRDVAEVQAEEDDRDFIRQQRAEKKRKDAENAETDRLRAFIARDAAEFTEAYPDVDLARLDNDKAFRRFCGSRYGREPLAELYEDYLEIAGEQRAAASAKAESRSRRETGAGSGSGGETLTARQQKELDEWNRAYPNMRMTAKEFLSR